MTRSELQDAIDIQQSRIAFEEDIYPKAQDQLILDLLLAEQKRSEGCDLCLFDDGTKVTHLVLAETCEGDANYCPRCGRDLTEGESV